LIFAILFRLLSVCADGYFQVVELNLLILSRFVPRFLQRRGEIQARRGDAVAEGDG
jgi:hypothetical protein